MLPVIPDSIQNLLRAIDAQTGMAIADFGSGSGFVALELAKKVGQGGAVYAIDILEAPLELIRTEASTMRLFNIKTILSDLEKKNGSTLGAESCDWVLIANILFQVPDQEAIVAEAKRVLKPRGRIAVVEWMPDRMPSVEQHPLSKQQTRALFEQNGLKLASQFEPDSAHYGMVFEK